MALRALATRMRSPAAAALRVLPPAPRVSPPAGTRPRFYTGRVTPEDRARKVLKDNLALLEEVKQHHEYMKSNVWWLEKLSKVVCFTFTLLSPVPLVAAAVRVD